MHISHEQYNSRDATELENSGTFINMAVIGGYWNSNYPSLSVHKGRSMYWQLIDAHHEGRFEHIINSLLGNRLSEPEVRAGPSF